MEGYRFLDEQGTFALEQPENYSAQYFPVAGEKGIKSALTPVFGGDSKRSQNEFLLEPVSVENLHNNRSTRNFWCHIEGMGNWSVTGASAEAEAYAAILPQADIVQLSDEVHEIEILLGKGEDGQQ